MSVKDIVLPLLPKGAEEWLRDAVYRRNCRLKPERYRSELERWYRLTTGRDPRLDDPQTLGEKIQWLKLYDSTPRKGRLADKWLAIGLPRGRGRSIWCPASGFGIVLTRLISKIFLTDLS